MDRPEPGLIKWSPSPSHAAFIHLNLQGRSISLFEPTGYAQRSRFDYSKISQHDDIPPLTTYDWAPFHNGLVAVGSGAGVVNLLKVGKEAGNTGTGGEYLELQVKLSRTCQAVAFNTGGLLAVGLDRVRNDQCLQVWDVNRFSSDSKGGTTFQLAGAAPGDPWKRLEPSVSVTSTKFFEDSPQTLVAGIRGQSLRIHDLREGHEAVVTYQTKANNNIAVDYADQNYFSSSSLDSPGVIIWDRRALNRSVATTAYLQAVDAENGVPWGAALRLDRAMDLETVAQGQGDRNSFIRRLAFNRDHRGMLAVLSRTGQLKVFSILSTARTAEEMSDTSPGLLRVRRSNDMDNTYSDTTKRSDRIVSFDWMEMGSPLLCPRLLVLRSSGALEVLEVPLFTRMYPYKLSGWQAPYRGLAEGTPYGGLVDFDKGAVTELLAPMYTDKPFSDVPIFGSDKVDVFENAQLALQSLLQAKVGLDDKLACQSPLPETFAQAESTAAKLKILRKYAQDNFSDLRDDDVSTEASIASRLQDSLSLDADALLSSRARHEKLLELTQNTRGFPNAAQMVLNHVPLLRAVDKYLFDCYANQRIISDDPWLQDVWDWVGGAEEAAIDGGMMSQPLDLSYLGVSSLWNHELGRDQKLRLGESATVPDDVGWEKCLAQICKKAGLPKYDGKETKYPRHRQLMLEICRWSRDADEDEFIITPSGDGSARPEKRVGWYTKRTARALFSGHVDRAVSILKSASSTYPELAFVSLAVQVASRSDTASDPLELDFDTSTASKSDPYLQAISSYIATGTWASVAAQTSLPLRDRAFIAIRNFADDHLTTWLHHQVSDATRHGDIEGIVLTGITESLVDILAVYVGKFGDVQTATLIMSFCAPRYIDDIRCTAWRNGYRAYLQRHRAFLQRTKFEVESTKRSRCEAGGRPLIKVMGRQIALRCVYCDSETTLHPQDAKQTGAAAAANVGKSVTREHKHPYKDKRGAMALRSPQPTGINTFGSGISCPNCKRHLPRCVVCLEVVGLPRSDAGRSESLVPASVAGTASLASSMIGSQLLQRHHEPSSAREDGKMPGLIPEISRSSELASRFPTFCLKCEHVLHLDHAREWFARHIECPVPECRCRCNFRANPELAYR